MIDKIMVWTCEFSFFRMFWVSICVYLRLDAF